MSIEDCTPSCLRDFIVQRLAGLDRDLAGKVWGLDALCEAVREHQRAQQGKDGAVVVVRADRKPGG